MAIVILFMAMLSMLNEIQAPSLTSSTPGPHQHPPHCYTPSRAGVSFFNTNKQTNERTNKPKKKQTNPFSPRPPRLRPALIPHASFETLPFRATPFGAPTFLASPGLTRCARKALWPGKVRAFAQTRQSR